jgi:hypothetical protein
MTHFDENAEYWGDQIKPIIGAANGRFTARSVKIFGDGECSLLREYLASIYTFVNSGALRSGGGAVRPIEFWLRLCAYEHVS